ncbi:hypothetical protein [Nonomuraea sp. SBT364]|nr:hypothetical protein [Nonomuraea sp. SBT364]
MAALAGAAAMPIPAAMIDASASPRKLRLIVDLRSFLGTEGSS